MGYFAQAFKLRHAIFSREQEKLTANSFLEQEVAFSAPTTISVTVKPSEKKADDFGYHLFSATVTQAVSYPARSIMNHAVLHTNLSATFLDAYPGMWRGVFANCIRGGIVFGGQAYTQDKIHEHYGANSTTGKILGILAPVALGTVVANVIEMPIIQYNKGIAISWNVRPGSILAAFGRETAFMLTLSPMTNLFLFNVGLSAIGQYHLVAHALDKNGKGFKAAAPYQIGKDLNVTERRIKQVKVAANMFLGRAMFLSVFTTMNRFMKDTVVPDMKEAQKKLGWR